MIHEVIPGVPMPSPWPINWEGTFEARILEFHNPTNFAYTKPEKYEELEKFEDEMYFDITDGSPNSSAFSNKMYAVLEGDTACRGELIKIEDGEATLKLIDRGMTLMHPCHDVYQLPLQYARAPPFCTKACISNVKPFYGDQWEMTCSLHYQRKLTNEKAKITIVRDHPTREGHEVKLYITQFEINLGESLIKNQLAQQGEYDWCLEDDIKCASPEEIYYLLDGELPPSFDPAVAEISQLERLEYLDLELEQEKEIELLTEQLNV